MFFKRMLLAVVLVIMSLPLVGSAQDDKVGEPLVVWSAGQIDTTDNSVFYSVLMSSGQEALTDVTVSALLPEGATFVKEFWKPEAATFVGENDGVVTWTLPAVEADVAAGPFTFVVSFANSDSEEFAPPASLKATLTSSAGTIESAADEYETTLTPLAESGSLDVIPEGFLDFTAVEDTGIWAYTPEGSVTAPVTLNFQRLPFDESAVLPEVAEETWWCGHVGISASSDVTLAQPLLLTIPLLRAVTPGTIMPVFARVEGGEWELISAENSLTDAYAEGDLEAPAFARVAPSATNAYILLNAPQFGSQNVEIAIGVNVSVRAVSTQKIGVIAVSSVPPINNATGSDPAPWF